MEDVKKYSDQELADKIAACRMRASEISDDLPYADGQAYYQDLDTINSLRQRLGVLQGEVTRRREINEEHARQLTKHIQIAASGMIGGQPQPLGLLIYELEHKISQGKLPDDLWAQVDEERQEALSFLRGLM